MLTANLTEIRQNRAACGRPLQVHDEPARFKSGRLLWADEKEIRSSDQLIFGGIMNKMGLLRAGGCLAMPLAGTTP